jgi:hypothetical protein
MTIQARAGLGRGTLGALSLDRSACHPLRAHDRPVFLIGDYTGIRAEEQPANVGIYFPASGRFPWFAFFMRSFFSLRRRVLAINPPLPGPGGPRSYI